MRARLAAVSLPDFGMPDAAPDLPPALYRARLQALRGRAERAGYDHLLVYGDREHSANLAWATGFDPRFEEALMVAGPAGDPALLTGNECIGLAAAAPLAVRAVLFQDFSLPGQPRDRLQPLSAILAREGVGPGERIGLIGWKTYGDPSASDVPSYIVDALRGLAGESGVVENATGLLIDAADGLRVINEVEQLAAFEYAACQASEGVKRVIGGLRPGMSEREAAQLLGWSGAPLSCHTMLSAGPRVRFGLLSPSDRRIGRGEPFTVAFGIWGALNCRAGFVVAEAAELAPEIRDYVDRLVSPYFTAIAAWYRTLGIGVAGAALQAVVDRHLGDPFFGVSLNPGHYIHLDEWVNSPVFPGSPIELRSGMALQADVIPATGSDYFTTNIEDGVALADEAVRAKFAQTFPDAWARIGKRRDFMRDRLGIDLRPEVLPFSNIPAWLPPFLLDPGRAMTMAPDATPDTGR